MATEKKIIKVESSESAKKATKKKSGIDLNDVKDFVVENKDTIIKVVEVAGAAIAAKKAKDEAWEKKSALEQALDHKRKRNKTVAWVIVIIVIILVFFLVLHYYVESSTPQLYYELESKGIV